ncbi:hypothetical protein DPMN_001649 [Dreissena polymorpha]|uniref:Uncharacterized protein n=1 Tax=Dreissena polymorpha TaxID=45954 RepID=A0A9D4RQI7_DREPO|nr:hypothetical protein DPMN_001649 [Dreissena polymorpha]
MKHISLKNSITIGFKPNPIENCSRLPYLVKNPLATETKIADHGEDGPQDGKCMTPDDESQRKLESARLKTITSTRCTTTIVTRNVPTLYQNGKTTYTFKLTILGIGDSR